jgi:hypothetical protein
MFLRPRCDQARLWVQVWRKDPILDRLVAYLIGVGSGSTGTSPHFDLEIESTWLGDAAQFRLEVSWMPETAHKAERLRATVQAKPVVEMAATALALVIAHHVLHLGQLDVTNYGDRTDFRSTRISCMLEVSGTAVHSQLTRRHRQKVAQAVANPLRWDAYVVVCVFSSRGHRIRLSFHCVQEPTDDQTPA